MAFFRRKNKIQVSALKAVAGRAIYQAHDFPTIDLIFTVADDDTKKRSDLTEITVSMTLWEAARVTQELHNQVSAGQMVLPKRPINVPWGEPE